VTEIKELNYNVKQKGRKQKSARETIVVILYLNQDKKIRRKK
jgi:hypothetical protein